MSPIQTQFVRFKSWFVLSLFAWLLMVSLVGCRTARAEVPVSYQLPFNGTPSTYRVTLAAVSADDPNWIISTFVAGGVRSVDARNGGKFTDTWDGLDDNGMPVPPGRYRIKGIFMPAQKWNIDGQYHSLIAKYNQATADSWGPRPDQDADFLRVFGHVFGPMTDIAVGPNGYAGFLSQYIENAYNPFLVDLNRPNGWDQVLKTYPSGGAAGGDVVACDGEMIWFSSSNEQGDDKGKLIVRADRAWGADKGHWGARGVKVPAVTTDMAAWKNPATGDRFLYVVQGAPVNKVLVLDGNKSGTLDGVTKGEVPVQEPLSVALDHTHYNRLAILHRDEAHKWTISTVALRDGVPQGQLTRLMNLPAEIEPADFEWGDDGSIYVSDEKANQVYGLSPKGQIVRRFATATFASGSYNPNCFLGPRKLALWHDAQGKERLLVLESQGPGRISEWSPDGQLMRQWFLSQDSNNGYTLDPEQPQYLYAVTHTGELARYIVNQDQSSWKLDALWTLPLGGGQYPRILHHNGKIYIAFAGGRFSNFAYTIYRIDGMQCVPSAAIVAQENQHNGFWWHDANGDGVVQPSEYQGTPVNYPSKSYTYWGDRWLDDFSLTTPNMQNKRQFMRLAPTGFDAHGNPMYDGTKWQTLLTDPIYQAKADGTASPLRGGNEVATTYSDWVRLSGSPQDGFYVADSSGPNNPGGLDNAGSRFSQFKLSRYLPDGKGGYNLSWRVGRKAWRVAEPGEVYGTQQLSDPIYGIVGVEDSNGLFHLYSEDGMYLDTLMFDAFRSKREKGGVYSQSGETWFGKTILDKRTGKVLLLMGRAQYCLYEVENWQPNFIQTLNFNSSTVILNPGQIAAPNQYALAVRSKTSPVVSTLAAHFHAAPAGGPSLDGSLNGWEKSEPTGFSLDNQRTAEARVLYDPQTLYIRWHMRLPSTFQPVDTGELDRIFTHERLADTLSFYIQGNVNAPAGTTEGRSGDARFVFALTRQGNNLRPVVLGMYSQFGGPGAQPMVYASPVGRVTFGHVAPLNVPTGYKVDADGKGFVLAAAIPRSAIPGLPPFANGLRTKVDFAATVAGVSNFWWANTGQLNNTQTTDEPSEARLYPGSWAEGQWLP